MSYDVAVGELEDTDILDTFEVVYLAAESLAEVSSDFVLDVSHLGVLSAVISRISGDAVFKKEATRLLAEKNAHELKALASSYSASERNIELLISFIDLYGEMGDVLTCLAPICEEVGCMDAYTELERLCSKGFS